MKCLLRMSLDAVLLAVGCFRQIITGSSGSCEDREASAKGGGKTGSISIPSGSSAAGGRLTDTAVISTIFGIA